MYDAVFRVDDRYFAWLWKVMVMPLCQLESGWSVTLLRASTYVQVLCKATEVNWDNQARLFCHFRGRVSVALFVHDIVVERYSATV